MKPKDRYRAAFTKRMNDIRDSMRIESKPAFVGDSLGNIYVPDREGFVYVRFFDGTTGEAHNPGLLPTYDDPVRVAFDGLDKKNYRIIGYWNVFENPKLGGLREHGDEHSFGGNDPTPIWQGQFMPWKVFSDNTAPGFSVFVFRWHFKSDAGWVPGGTMEELDLTSSIPASGALYVLIEVLQADGSINAVDGTPADYVELLDGSSIPEGTAGSKQLAAVRLYAGQSSIDNETDIWDLRQTVGGGLSSDLLVNPSVVDNMVSFSTTTGGLKDSGFAAHAPVTLPTDSGLELDEQEINMGVPSTLNKTTTNSLTGSTHSHAIEGFVRSWLKSADPSVTDDLSAGYLKTDVWLNQTTGDLFICLDNANGAAIWFLSGSSGSGGGSDYLFAIDGALAVATNVPNAILATKDFEIGAVYIYCKDKGASSSTIVDINKNGTTVFTTQANRPELAWNDADGWAKGIPDITTFVEGDIITLDIDQISPGAEDMVVVLSVLSAGETFNLIVDDGVTEVTHVGRINIENGEVVDEGDGEVTIKQKFTVDDGATSVVEVNKITIDGGVVSDEGGGEAKITSLIASITTVQTRVQDSYSATTSGDGTQITPLDIVLTPKKTGNKIILEWIVNCECNQDAVFIVTRNGTRLAGTTDVSNNRWAGIASMPYDNNDQSTLSNMVIKIIDENSLNVSTTYALHIRSSYGVAQTLFLNRTVTNTGADQYEATLSTAMAMEINT